ncbi:gliding motility-associated C-terminal domain-containing protein [Paraflavisolibacter sp. H34]|uniref:T9SS type B sorting domain-containing protein n=1 Tax=Huijunlia imazamoxiresistens TaxID=3127457 RepID=UPI00301611C1
MRYLFFAVVFLIGSLVISVSAGAQSCSQWLSLPKHPSYMRIGDLDISGNQLTVEAQFNRTASWSGSDLYQGDLVSKHEGPSDCNYLLRPGSAEITTSNGYFKTPAICPITLNKTYHVAMVYDGTTLKFYRNGFLMSQVAATGNLVQNDWQTQIGLYFNQVVQENFIGYINEVRIWKVARTQSEIRSYMNRSLPSPQTLAGLQAYYTFDNLLNKQGNTAWNGTLSADAAINRTNPNCTFIPDSCAVQTQATFFTPDTVCVNDPVPITNFTTGASSYFWNFCVANPNTPPQGVNMGNIGGAFSGIVYIDYVLENGRYYGFVTDNYTEKLYRLDFGNSLLNTPTVRDLGNVGNVIPEETEGIQVVKNEGKWYAFIVGGDPADGSVSKIVKIEFGTNIANNAPVGVDWGNIGDLAYPHDLYMFEENGHWYGFTVNTASNTLTRFDFSTSFSNSPNARNLGNIGNLSGPTGVNALKDGSEWHVFVTNAISSSLTRLDFGTSLLNTPTGVNMGNIGGAFQTCWDIYIMKYCGSYMGFVINANTSYNDLLKLDFKGSLKNVPAITSYGNVGNLNFPHCLSKFFREGPDLYTFVPNVSNRTLSRIRFTGCANSSLPSSTLQHPPAIDYNTPGTYNINLTIDDGLSTQASFCRNVVVLPRLPHNPPRTLTLCAGETVRLQSAAASKNYWSTGSTANFIDVSTPGTYWVQTSNGPCPNIDTFILTTTPSVQIFNRDTTIVEGNGVFLNSTSSNGIYQWTPAAGLSCSNCSSPVAYPATTTTYRLSNGSGNCSIDEVKITVLPKSVVAPCTNFQLEAGGTGSDKAYDVAVSTGGDYFVAGTTTSFGNAADILITKFSATGKVLWSKAYGGTAGESVRKITAAGDGGLLVTGQSTSFGNSSGDILCFKIDNGGTVLWSRKLGTSSAAGDLGMDIIETSDGGYALSGVLNAAGGIADAVLIKLDKNAQVSWSKRFDRGDGEDGVGLLQKSDTLVMAVDLQNTTANYEAAVMKLKLSDGSVLQAKKLTPSVRGLFQPYLHFDPARAGYLVSAHSITGSSYADMRHTIIALDESFGVTRTQTLQVSPLNNDFYTGFFPLPDGSFISSGSSRQATGGFLYRAVDNNALQFAKHFGGTGDKRLNRLTVAGGHVVAVGSTGASGQEDFFVAALNTDGSTSRDCGVENGAASAAAAPVSVSNFTWPTIRSVSFGNTVISLTARTVTLDRKDLCADACDTVRLTGPAKACSLKDTLTFSLNRAKNCTQPYTITSDNILFDIVAQNDTVFRLLFKQEGTAKVRISLTNACSMVLDSLTVEAKFSAASPDFTFSRDACSPLTVQFTPSLSGMQTYQWTFSGGAQSTQASPKVTFGSAGLQRVTLRVQSTNNCWDSISKKVPVLVESKDLIANKDTAICAGDSVQLRTQPTDLGFCWTPAAALSSSNAGQPFARPLANTTYTFTSLTVGANLVANGDFSSGYTGFTSSYQNAPATGTSAGVFHVAAATQGWRPGLSACTDHTTGNGNMLLVNGDNSQGINLWSQTVSLQPHTNYLFSVWVQTLNAAAPAKLQFSINGRSLDTVFSAGRTSCNWSRYQILWNSGDTLLAALSLVNANPDRSASGFALDDLFFGPVDVSREAVNISVKERPVVSLGADTTLCSGQSVRLQATVSGGSLSWQPQTYLDDPGRPDPVATPGQTIIYRAEVTNAAGCRAVDSTAVTVLQTPVIVFPADNSICQGASTALTPQVQHAGSYQWVPADGLSDPLAPRPEARPQTTMVYTLTARNGKCSATGQTTVQVKPLPVLDISPDTAICEGMQLPLLASGALHYRWQPLTGLSAGDISNPVAAPLADTRYFVTATGANGCEQVDSVQVTVARPPVFSLQQQKPYLCQGDTMILRASGGDRYEWSPLESPAAPSVSTVSVFPETSTRYQVVITHLACKKEETLFTNVMVRPRPELRITKSNDIDCSNGEAHLAVVGGETYEWMPAASLSDTRIANPVATPLQTTTYRVKATAAGCSDTASVTVDVVSKPDYAYYLPNAFTPNHDGKNDCFGVRPWAGVQEFSMSLYNRWGQLVFSTNDPRQCWDGTFKGMEQPSGVFVYLIRAQTLCGSVNKKGTVVLIR